MLKYIQIEADVTRVYNYYFGGHGGIWCHARMDLTLSPGHPLVWQLVDSYIVLFIAFSGILSWQQIVAVGMMNYTYKFTVAIILTPLIYFLEKKIERYFCSDFTRQMKLPAMDR